MKGAARRREIEANSRTLTLATVIVLVVQSAGAVDSGTKAPPREYAQQTEPYNTGWMAYFDNDLFLGTDEGYTGGFAVTLSGRRATEYAFSLDPALQAINRWLGVGHLHAAPDTQRRHSIEFGVTSFTPKEIGDPAPLFGDRPYACLVFMGNLEQVVLARPETAYQTTFMLGLLGTSFCQAIQESLHDLVGGAEPRGWDHQISDGGEPTLQWSLSREQLLTSGAGNGRHQEVIGMLETAVGYTTHVGAGLSWRYGRIRSPWWSFIPHHAEYIDLGIPAARTDTPANGPGEFYVWARAMLRYRLYNAILQGQFRDSDVEFSRSDLNPLIARAWIGVTMELKSGLEVSFVVGASSRDLEDINNRNPVWSGVILRRAI